MIKIGLIASVCSGLLILTACGQKNTDSQESVEQKEIEQTILSGELSTGDWIQRSNDNEEVLMFGLNQTEPKLLFRCNLTTKQIFVVKGQYIRDRNEIQVKLVTSTGSKNYQATVENHGFPAINFAFDPDDPFLTKIAETEDKFAVIPEVGKKLLIPASPQIKELFTQCS